MRISQNNESMNNRMEKPYASNLSNETYGNDNTNITFNTPSNTSIKEVYIIFSCETKSALYGAAINDIYTITTTKTYSTFATSIRSVGILRKPLKINGVSKYKTRTTIAPKAI